MEQLLLSQISFLHLQIFNKILLLNNIDKSLLDQIQKIFEINIGLYNNNRQLKDENDGRNNRYDR